MSSLFASLLSSSDALRVFQRSLDVVQNNVTNSSTPGYAKQNLTLEAKPFEPASGLAGGVQAGSVVSARSEYAETAVQSHVTDLGYSAQKVTNLSALETVYDVSGDSGIGAAMSGLFQSFSALSLTPNSTTARQNVIESAQTLAQSFQVAASNLARVSDQTDLQIRQTVSQVNALGEQIASLNKARQQTPEPDAGLDAQLHATLEELAAQTGFNALYQPDGTVTVLLGGQVPLVIGENAYSLSAVSVPPSGLPGTDVLAPPKLAIRNADGQDVTAGFTTGSLGGLLDVRNRVLPQQRGDEENPGDLNLLAATVADTVNQLLRSGVQANGTAGVDLFTWDTAHGSAAARTLAVNTAVSDDPSLLAIAETGPPPVANGIALKIAALTNPPAALRIAGLGYVEFYGKIAADVGEEVQLAKTNQTVQSQAVVQAKNLRSEISGVSLDEEAAVLIQFQRAYQAAAKMVTVLNDLTETTINLLS